MMETEFIFVLTNAGSEKALKREVEMAALPWRAGYQRRGFVTFKADGAFSLVALDVELACARRLCLSLGKFLTLDAALARIVAIQPHAIIHQARFHERKMQGVKSDSPLEIPSLGTIIGTVVELGPSEFWAGLHRHTAHTSPDPAGDSGIEMPPHSPSRAWLKLEEAFRFFGLEFTPRDLVVELGCAPGGVVLALLDREVPVIGVDPAKMAPVVLASAIAGRQDAPVGRPWFFHCRKPAALVGKRDLGPDVTWFMSDMNQSPDVVLRECARFCRMAPSIRSVLITLKLTDVMQVADKASWFAALAGMGFKTIRLQQLAVHHREFALLATRSPSSGTMNSQP